MASWHVRELFPFAPRQTRILHQALSVLREDANIPDARRLLADFAAAQVAT
jgi:hypothetical protein